MKLVSITVVVVMLSLVVPQQVFMQSPSDTCVYDVVITHELDDGSVPPESFDVTRESLDSSGKDPFKGTYFYRATPPDNSEASVVIPQVGTIAPAHEYALTFAYFRNNSPSEVVGYVRVWVGNQVINSARFTVPSTGQWVLREFPLRLDQLGRDFSIQYGLQGAIEFDAISVVTSRTPTGYTCYRMYVPSIIGGMKTD